MAGLDAVADQDTGDTTAPPIPYGGSGMSSQGALPTFGGSANDLIDKVLKPGESARRAYVAGALTPGGFGASMRGALTEVNAAEEKEKELRLRYIPIV